MQLLTKKLTLGRIGCLSRTLLVNFWPQLTSPTLFLFLQAKAHGKTCPVFINYYLSFNNSYPAYPHLWSRYLVGGRWASSWRGSPSQGRTGGRTWSERCRCSFDLTARGYILREWLFLLPPCKQQLIRKLIVELEANVFSISLFVITWWLWQRGEHNCTIDMVWPLSIIFLVWILFSIVPEQLWVDMVLIHLRGVQTKIHINCFQVVLKYKTI